MMRSASLFPRSADRGRFCNFSSPASTASGWRWNQRGQRRREAADIESDGAGPAVRTPKMARLEAALFVAESALSAKKLSQIATLADSRETVELITALNGLYDADDSAFRIEQVAAGFQLLTRSELSPWLDRFHHRQARLKLSAPMMETLTIIAYRQPCTRADVEAIRGVQSAEIIKQLMERNLVRVTGEDTSLGRPYLYGTTRLFLETFGFSSLKDLPHSSLLKRTEAVAEPEQETADSEEAIGESSEDQAAA